jgi:hypothetical protein
MVHLAPSQGHSLLKQLSVSCACDDALDLTYSTPDPDPPRQTPMPAESECDDRSKPEGQLAGHAPSLPFGWMTVHRCQLTSPTPLPVPGIWK